MSIMSKLFCRDDIGIDFGAANMRVWIRGERRERVIDRVCVVHGVHKNDEVNCRVVFDGNAEDVWRQFFEDYKERTFANDGSSLFEQVKGVCEANATERRSHHA